MTIREAIRQMAAAGTEPYCKVCTVDAVDEDARTVDCTPLDESAPLLGVNLQANQECGEGVVLFPAVGSYVVVSFLGASVAVVVLTEKVDKIDFKIGNTSAEIVDGQVDIAVQDTTVKISPEEVVINGGGLGGMVNIEQLTKHINAIEEDINELKSVFSRWIVTPQDGGKALFDVVKEWSTPPLELTRRGDYENEKVKHG